MTGMDSCPPQGVGNVTALPGPQQRSDVTHSWTSCSVLLHFAKHSGCPPCSQKGQGAVPGEERKGFLSRASQKHERTQYILGVQVQSLKGDSGWNKAAEAGRVRSERLTQTWSLSDGKRKPGGFEAGSGTWADGLLYKVGTRSGREEVAWVGRLVGLGATWR